jgi:hypothetical protein
VRRLLLLLLRQEYRDSLRTIKRERERERCDKYFIVFFSLVVLWIVLVAVVLLNVCVCERERIEREKEKGVVRLT